MLYRRKVVECLEAALQEAMADKTGEADELKALVEEMQQETRELAAGVIARGGTCIKILSDEPKAKRQRSK